MRMEQRQLCGGQVVAGMECRRAALAEPSAAQTPPAQQISVLFTGHNNITTQVTGYQ